MRCRWLSREDGYTLMEVLVGLAVLLLVIGVIGNMEITAYRTKHAYDRTYQQLAESSPAVDWIVRDIRRAADVTTASGSSLVLAMSDESTISYALSGQEVTRTADGTTTTVGSSVTALAFSKDSSSTVTVQMQVTFTDGGNYQVTTYAIPRAKAKPAS